MLLKSMVAAIIRPQTVAALESLATQSADKLYRPFLPSLPTPDLPTTPLPDWTDALELDAVTAACRAHPQKLKLLVLYGSLRERYANSSQPLVMPISPSCAVKPASEKKNAN